MHPRTAQALRYTTRVFGEISIIIAVYEAIYIAFLINVPITVEVITALFIIGVALSIFGRNYRLMIDVGGVFIFTSLYLWITISAYYIEPTYDTVLFIFFIGVIGFWIGGGWWHHRER